MDTTQDDQNCGQCNKVCPSGSTCTSSTCQCSGGMTLCTSGCTDTMSDMYNCGSCGTTCTSTQTCVSGTCQSASKKPPQGTCSHDLCIDGLGPLTSGCDSAGCVSSVCLQDSFCCDIDWDIYCVGEVDTYCSPYSCL